MAHLVFSSERVLWFSLHEIRLHSWVLICFRRMRPNPPAVHTDFQLTYLKGSFGTIVKWSILSQVWLLPFCSVFWMLPLKTPNKHRGTRLICIPSFARKVPWLMDWVSLGFGGTLKLNAIIILHHGAAWKKLLYTLNQQVWFSLASIQPTATHATHCSLPFWDLPQSS